MAFQQVNELVSPVETQLSPPGEQENQEKEGEFHPKKKAKTSVVWNEFVEEMDKGLLKAKCKHCNNLMSYGKGGATTHLSRHLKTCGKRAQHMRNQAKLNLVPIATQGAAVDNFVSALHDGKLDMMKMREAAAHWILMHDHAFSTLEEEGFNLFMKRACPDWKKISRKTCRDDCFKVYEIEKEKMKKALAEATKISLTTDLWQSKPQRMEYMVITAHFIDSAWKLQKRVINFFHLPPPRRGVDLADAIFKCLKEWEIENKIFTIIVDNAAANDVCIRVLKDTLSTTQKLACGGKLFHHRCAAHISNIMVQHGLEEVKMVTKIIHQSVDYVRESEQRLKLFAEIAQQLHLPQRKLILEFKTRWNSTYEMLATALRFKEVFVRYKDRDSGLDSCCPHEEEWRRIRKVCDFLKVFKSATNIISGSHYLTSNLFLNEVYRVKVVLDKGFESVDSFINDLSRRMKESFDKYWGECDLLMAFGSVLDPRCKLKALEFFYSRMYPSTGVEGSIAKVKKALSELYNEYAREHSADHVEDGSGNNGSSGDHEVDVNDSNSGWSEYLNHMRNISTLQPQKTELDKYLDEGCYICDGDSTTFDALEWWKGNSLRYRILSKMAVDVLAISMTVVALESTFSASGRAIDPYRACLDAETVQVLLCAGDWCRALHGVKKKIKETRDEIQEEIMLPS